MQSSCVGSFGPCAVAQAQLLQLQQVFAQLRSGAFGCGAGIVQLVHQPGRERAQRDKFLAMQRLHLIGLQPLRHVGQHHFARSGQQASSSQNCSLVKRTSTGPEWQ